MLQSAPVQFLWPPSTAGASASAFRAAKDAHISATAKSLILLRNLDGDQIDAMVCPPPAHIVSLGQCIWRWHMLITLMGRECHAWLCSAEPYSCSPPDLDMLSALSEA